MTAEEVIDNLDKIARDFDWAEMGLPIKVGGERGPHWQMVDTVLRYGNELIAEEREACAKIAESTVQTFEVSQSETGIQGIIAKAIRERPNG